ncbi:hypothetical protein [Mesorhizobium sp. CN2-181]|uniref:hypothetical protein n=1 Tax=Mesorhizobium yinganensis TaxID=3157707 RepID=UPI0032B70EBD
MSAVLSAETDYAVVVLSDCAAYNRDGVIMGIQSKIRVSEKVPLAVVSRGQIGFGDTVSKAILDLIEAYGFDQGIKHLAGMMEEFALWPDRGNKGDWLIAGMSETHGARHMTFQNFENSGWPALELRHPGQMHAGIATGAEGEQTGLAATGCRKPYRGESPEEYFSETGVQMFEHYRRIPWEPAKWGEPDRAPQYLIGGRLEMAVVDAEGVRVRTLHTWPDRIGERINPPGGNVTPLNRQQRRSAEWGLRA